MNTSDILAHMIRDWTPYKDPISETLNCTQMAEDAANALEDKAADDQHFEASATIADELLRIGLINK